MIKEEKEKLIELSDLNREDNVKYISSEAQGIAITLDSDRYAPTLCKLERAYICGRRKSENRITELEQENAELKEKLAGAERTRDNLIQLGFPTFQSCKEYADKMNYSKTIIKDLLDNSDEYARQRAEEFLKE